MLKEFRDFIARGNVIDLAVGIIIGGAFGKIVSSLVGDMLMPLIGLVIGKISFSTLYFALDFNHYDNIEAAKAAHAPLLMYGNFLQACLDFIIIAFAIFMLVRATNKMRDTSPTTKDCPSCTLKIPIAAKKCPQCTADLAAAKSF